MTDSSPPIRVAIAGAAVLVAASPAAGAASVGAAGNFAS